MTRSPAPICTVSRETGHGTLTRPTAMDITSQPRAAAGSGVRCPRTGQPPWCDVRPHAMWPPAAPPDSCRELLRLPVAGHLPGRGVQPVPHVDRGDRDQKGAESLLVVVTRGVLPD